MKKTMPQKKENSIPDGVLALELLKKKICDQMFKPGENVRESLLARELGLNRSAIRSALNQLVALNVFEYVPFCGYRVRDFNIKSIIQWYELRAAIEPAACRRLALLRPEPVIALLKEYNAKEEQSAPAPENAPSAAQKDPRGYYDFQFHRVIVSNCGNVFFEQIQNSFSLMSPFFQFGRFSKLLTPTHSNDVSGTILSHDRIIAAIENGDIPAAEKEARMHIEGLLNRVVNLSAYL